MPPSRPTPSAQPIPVLRTLAGYSAPIMPLIPVMLPVVQQPIRKIVASSGRYGRFTSPTTAIATTPPARLTATTLCGMKR